MDNRDWSRDREDKLVVHERERPERPVLYDYEGRPLIQDRRIGYIKEDIMPKGGKVDRAIKSVMASGKSEGNAIAILKSRGVIKQVGKHLAPVRKTSR